MLGGSLSNFIEPFPILCLLSLPTTFHIALSFFLYLKWVIPISKLPRDITRDHSYCQISCWIVISCVMKEGSVRQTALRRFYIHSPPSWALGWHPMSTPLLMPVHVVRVCNSARTESFSPLANLTFPAGQLPCYLDGDWSMHVKKVNMSPQDRGLHYLHRGVACLHCGRAHRIYRC